MENLEASGLVREFGVQATCATTGEQWDAPNAWPPLVDMLVEGLLGLDHDGASQLARSIGTAWLASVKAGFEASGAFFYKHDADARGKRGARRRVRTAGRLRLDARRRGGDGGAVPL